MSSRLAAGNQAPHFVAKDTFGNTVDPRRVDSKYLLITFLRYSGCPWCNLAIHRLTMEHPIFAKNNCEIIAVVQSPKENIAKNIYDRHAKQPAFPIIPDPGRKLYDLYGLTLSAAAVARSITDIPHWVHSVKDKGFKQTTIDGNLFLVPAMFLINTATQEILKAHYQTSFYDHAVFTNVYESLFFEE